MARFGELIENSEKTEAYTAEKYKNIKPIEKMSDDEMADFWAQEFEKGQDKTGLDIYDKLVSEIYNRSEDEIKIDFDIDSRFSTLLDKFSSEAWAEMAEDEKLTIMEKFVQEIGDRLGLEKTPGIEIFNGETGISGEFERESNVIRVNQKHLDEPADVVNTIAHEARHAYQGMRAETFETWEDALFQCNMDNYIFPLPLPGGGFLYFMDYYNQYLEVDARAFANIFTEAMR